MWNNKMLQKNKVLWIFVLLMVLFSIMANAQEVNNVYIINLNYKEVMFAKLLSLVDIRLAKGSVQDYSLGTADYRLDLVSKDNQILKTIKFNLPLENSKDFNFTITIPYFNNGKLINIYDKNNNKVLEIPITQDLGLPSMEIEGELVVHHVDDFKNPENSRYDFFLIAGKKRYELKSDKQLPIVKSGTLAKVKGKISNNTVLVENLEIKGSATETSQLPVKEAQPPPKKESSKINLNWIYGGIVILLVISLLIYVLIRRKQQ